MSEASQPKPITVLTPQDFDHIDRLNQRSIWLRANGINPDDTYRVEVYYEDGALLGQVFEYLRDEAGKRSHSDDCDHEAGWCELASRSYQVKLNSMPPGRG